MRTAEAYLSDIFNNYGFTTSEREAVSNAFNAGRKEAIEECARQPHVFRLKEKGMSEITGIDKEAILSLIKELK